MRPYGVDARSRGAGKWFTLASIGHACLLRAGRTVRLRGPAQLSRSHLSDCQVQTPRNNNRIESHRQGLRYTKRTWPISIHYYHGVSHDLAAPCHSDATCSERKNLIETLSTLLPAL